MKANPDYKWHNPEKGMQPAGLLARSPIKGMGQDNFDFSRAEQTITPGKLAGKISIYRTFCRRFISKRNFDKDN